MLKLKLPKTVSDLIYTIMGTVVINVVLQIIIYPLITHLYGEDVTGDILFFMGVIYIVPQALGATLNNVRLMIRKECDATNYDFLPFLFGASGLSSLICAYVGIFENHSLGFALCYGIFSVIYLLRIYASVEFRLDLRIKEYFLYYCLVCIGYLCGLGLYIITDVWLLIFLCGECLALTYSVFKGRIFRNDGKSGNRNVITKMLSMVLLSTIMRDCVNQFDKVILKQAMSSSVVIQYHVVSLIAKTMLMFVQPINSLILTYLTVKDAHLTKKQLFRFTKIALVCGLLFYLISIIGTPVFVKLFYPDLYSVVIPYNYMVNLGLIIGFVSTLFMSILLSQGKTAIHMTIQCVWGVGYIVLAYYFVTKYMLWGLVYVTLGANLLKLFFAIIFTIYGNEKNENLLQ